MAASAQDRLARHEYEFTIIIERDEDGAYIAHCPALSGCHSAGDTEEEAREMIADAITLYIDLLHDRGEEIPADVNVTTIRVVA